MIPEWLRFPFKPAAMPASPAIAPIPDDETDPLLAYLNMSSNFSPKAEGSSNAFIQIESSKIAAVLWISAFVAAVAAFAAIFCIIQSRESERETRLLEYYVMELDGKLMQAGVINFKDSYSAKKQERQK